MTDALWTVTTSVLLPQPAVLFALFQTEAGTVAGAREALVQPDAANVYRSHFTGSGAQPAEQVRMLADVSCLGDALFVRQLEEAGNVETDASPPPLAPCPPSHRR